MSHFRMAYCGFLMMVLVGICGCAPTATTKPDPASLPEHGAASAKSSDTARSGEGQHGGTKESDASSSSLKALQEGKPPITPASSPLKDVFFDFDRYDLSADARGVFRANAEWLKNNPSARVDIEGHCDERGTNEYNLALGAKRAQARARLPGVPRDSAGSTVDDQLWRGNPGVPGALGELLAAESPGALRYRRAARYFVIDGCYQEGDSIVD